MSPIPLPALDIRPPQMADPMDSYVKAMQLRALMQGQQLSAAELQQKQLQTQQMKLTMQGEQRVIDAQQDPAWDPTDTDKAVKVLMKHSVPLEVAGRVIQGLTQVRQGLAQQSSENLKFASDAHSYFDDQFESVKSAPDSQKQTIYQKALQNATAYTNQLPEGPGKQGLLAEIQQAPPLYDATWINEQHAQLKTGAALTEEALKNATAAKDTGEAALANAKVRGAQAESTIQQQQAALTPEQRAMQGNLPYQAAGGSPQAQAALGVETRQKTAVAGAEASARVGAEMKAYGGAVPAVAGVPPHLVPAALTDYQKAGTEFAESQNAAQDMKTFIDQARGGNKVAYSYAPVEGVLQFNTARGIKRVNMSEIESYAGAGSGLDRIKAFLGKQSSGASIPAGVLDDMQQLHASIATNAGTLYTNKLKVINQAYGSKFVPVDLGQSSTGPTTKADPLGIR